MNRNCFCIEFSVEFCEITEKSLIKIIKVMKPSDRNISEMLDKLLKHQDYDEVPEGFPDKVMSRVHLGSVSAEYQYTPLIGKWFWIFLGGLLVGLFILALLFPSEPVGWLSVPLDYLSGIYEGAKSIFKISTIIFNDLDTSLLFPVIIPSFILLIIFDRLIHFLMKSKSFFIT